MPTRQEINNDLSSILTPIIEVSQHLQANQVMLDYVDQEISIVISGNTWPTDKPNYYTRTQVDTIVSTKADLVGGKVPLSQLPTGITSTDTYVTGGTYNNGTGIATFRNNSGGTFTVSGFNTGVITGTTDTYVTGGTYSTGTLTLRNNTGGTFTVSGFLTGSTIPTLQQVTSSGNDTTNNLIVLGNNNRYLRLGSDINTDSFVQFRMALGSPMLQYSSQGGGITSIYHSSSGSREMTFADANGTIPMTVNGIAPNSGGNITLTGLSSSDTFVTGGTYSAGVATFRTNSGTSFNVTGFYTGGTDTYVTGGTYNSSLGVATFRNNQNASFTLTGFNTGSTTPTLQQVVVAGSATTGNIKVNSLTADYIKSENNSIAFGNSSRTVLDFLLDVPSNYVATTSFEYLSDDRQYHFPNASGTIAVSVNGINADTFGNIEIGALGGSDTYVTGGTYSNGTATFRNNSGNTFSVSGFHTGTTDTVVTGGTYSAGVATFRNNLGNTFNVSGFFTGSTEVFVTGGTHAAGTTTFRNNTGGTFTVTGYQNGNSNITLTGVVSGTGTSSIATTLNAASVTNAMLAGSISDDKIASSAAWNNKADKYATVKNVTGNTYTVLSGDNGTVLSCTHASGCTMTVPSGLTNGFNCLVIQSNFYPIDFTAGAGATLSKKSSHYATTYGQYAVATLLQIATNQVLLTGDLEPIP